MKRILIIAAAAAALIAAGCGESQQFTEDFNEAQKPLEQLLADVQGSAGTPDKAKMDKLAQGLDDTADKIADLNAPDDAKDELDAFVEEVHTSADHMRSVGEAVAGGKPEEMTAALGKLSASMGKVSSAQSALQTAIN
jgi:methyl-accepting chemotaxis protein